ncbi:MAG: alpha-glucosidase [Chloroflexi bacterium]|nr:alpha-glucosidase [Chloroflexota bacterium]
MSEASDYLWWKHGVIGQILPRSYYDTNGDGSGDLPGIIKKLDYLVDLGIDGIWLGPINKSPMVDFGYDVADYRSINPIYGTMADFEQLLAEAHRRNIRIIMDLVVNHTSDQHAWFKESRSSRDNPKRDWYIWHDGKKGRAPSNWQAAVGGSVWQWDRTTKQYYLHSYFRAQPDLNWRNPAVRQEIYATMRFWLDKGVDGFRCDVLNYFLKDDHLRDNPWSLSAGIFNGFQKHLYSRSQPGMEEILRQMRAVLDEYKERMMVGEVYVAQDGPAMAGAYMGKGDLCHLSFEFSLIFTKWDAVRFKEMIKRWYSVLPAEGWPCNVLSNHDQPRAVTRYAAGADSQKRAKVMAALLLTLRGTPFLYYGEEIGMPDGPIKRSDVMDTVGKMYWPIVKGRDAERTPMQWDSGAYAGFSSVKPWLPLNKDFSTVNVEVQDKDPSSVLNFYRKLTALRRAQPALQKGGFEWIELDKDLIAYRRTWQGSEVTVILNFSGSSRVHKIAAGLPLKVLLGTHRDSGSPVDKDALAVYPYEVLVLGA